MEDTREHNVIELPAVVFYGLISASLLGGAGGYSVLGPHLEKQTLESCYNNSQTALEVTAQHGKEFNDVRAAITENRRLIFEKTQSRYTAEDASKQWREQERIDHVQNRRLDYLERQVEKNHD